MPRTIRGRCRSPARAGSALLATVICLLPVGLSESMRWPAVSRADSAGHPIIVNSAQADAGNSGKITLTAALALAARDPRDNVIRFDPTVFGRSTTLALPETVIPPATQAGKDRIEGPSGRDLTLDASGVPDAGFIIGHDAWLGLSNLTIRGGGQRAILLKEQGRAVLENVILLDSPGPAIALFGESRLELDHCRLRAARTHGLEIHGKSTAVLKSVEIAECQQSAVAAFEQASVQADRSRFKHNGHWNLVLTGQARAELDGCALTGARFANADVSESARLDARACLFEDGERFGLFLTGHAAAQLRFTQVREHGSRGIEMQNHASLMLEGAHIDANRDYGVILFEQCSIRAAGSKFTRNQGHGVSLRGRSSGDFKICLFAGNRYSGIGCMDARDGGKVKASQCLFEGNGMRPIYRGPLHLDPLVPTPLTIDDEAVECMADPGAVIELYLDKAGEASRYLKTMTADARGRFVVNRNDVPAGWVMSATATIAGSTSEFNVIAGSTAPDVLGALLARTGPLSDTGGDTDLDGGLRRWRPGTKLILHVPNPPSAAVEEYTRFVADRVIDWTRGAVSAELSVGAVPKAGRGTVVVPVEYLPADAPALLGRGGVTFMKWDSQGYFVSPMKILLAEGKEARDTCPRVLAHEFGHVLGLSHARVGLLSRMQGSMPPSEAFVNDFSPMLTFYDVLALHVLHQSEWNRHGSGTLRQLVSAGLLPAVPKGAVASLQPGVDQPTYSPPPVAEPQAPVSGHTPRP
ncbi:MAG TPA: right-handed parallel beta-helix repeat-containing protein [Phycisphaerae bacterium]|nr:right-handed parallel beta-helix repeat-containing protein [Phycisphaerae bacterium]HOJ73682.1 right-handed parallel beta-helix repeat-containing protein [Phycisphaerae bacterium]HOM50329.1 right-handed parallel beta-helix repeat-containing protein [Phycisphaerae bacterium]HOQ84956.1 right-handed parallel beta-helix repeat-containing protein [Phycisphaerae bacterium]HPP27238.1 right-handed parallel beta-helix repeat-containing protein [Phycisphaerae bacterium]